MLLRVCVCEWFRLPLLTRRKTETKQGDYVWIIVFTCTYINKEHHSKERNTQYEIITSSYIFIIFFCTLRLGINVWWMYVCLRVRDFELGKHSPCIGGSVYFRIIIIRSHTNKSKAIFLLWQLFFYSFCVIFPLSWALTFYRHFCFIFLQTSAFAIVEFLLIFVESIFGSVYCPLNPSLSQVNHSFTRDYFNLFYSSNL